MARTLRWARRARDRFLALRDRHGARRHRDQSRPGAVRHRAGRRRFRELREESARETVAIGFEAYAIGGLSVGEPPRSCTTWSSGPPPWLPEDRPRYLMGAGTPEDLVESVARGRGPVRLRAADAQRPERPAVHQRGANQHQERAVRRGRAAARSGVRLLHVPDLPHAPICGICFMAGEINAATLNTLHNLHFYLDTLGRIRDAIVFGRFESFRLRVPSELVPPSSTTQ